MNQKAMWSLLRRSCRRKRKRKNWPSGLRHKLKKPSMKMNSLKMRKSIWRKNREQAAEINQELVLTATVAERKINLFPPNKNL